MDTFAVDHFKDISFADPQENILYDEVLLSLAEEGKLKNTLRLWESTVYCVVLGKTGKLHDDVILPAVKSSHLPVLRRSSAGGTVLQGLGCLNFSFILSKETCPKLSDLSVSYHIILEGVLSLLKDLGVEGVFRPTSDLALEKNEKKFSGNAQRRLRRCILHHGTLLYNFDLSLVPRYLTMPKDIPPYRQGRLHEEFITNIGISKNALFEKFKSHYFPQGFVGEGKPTPEEKELLAKFLRERPATVTF